MRSSGGGIVWTGNLRANLAALPARQRAAVAAAARYTAPQIESWMKGNARWTDQTGAARNGLRAEVQISGDDTSIVLYHSVPYGIFLEVRWGGKYAIIGPAMQYWSGYFVDVVAKLLFEDTP